MDLVVNVDAARPLALLRNGGKRMAYACVNAVNDAAKYVQKREHEHVRSLFNIRAEVYLFGTPGRPGGAAGRITQFASVGKSVFTAKVEVHGGSIASGRRLLLPIFEGGGTKERRAGSHSIAVPVTGTARPNMASTVAPQLTISSLRLQKFVNGKRVVKPRRGGKKSTQGVFGEFGVLKVPTAAANTQWKGSNRSFLLTSSKRMPEGGILQRVRPGRGGLRLLYKFKKDVKIPDVLRFTHIFNTETPPYFQKALKREVDAALAYALTGVKL